MQKKAILVTADWDDEAGVWVATSTDVPGLVAEAETVEAMSAKLRILIPELLEANGVSWPEWDGEVPFELLSRRMETVARAAH
jgi:predicted RNase H-like HicB family nuclease